MIACGAWWSAVAEEAGPLKHNYHSVSVDVAGGYSTVVVVELDFVVGSATGDDVRQAGSSPSYCLWLRSLLPHYCLRCVAGPCTAAVAGRIDVGSYTVVADDHAAFVVAVVVAVSAYHIVVVDGVIVAVVEWDIAPLLLLLTCC